MSQTKKPAAAGFFIAVKFGVAKTGSDSIFLRGAIAKFEGAENIESDPVFADHEVQRLPGVARQQVTFLCFAKEK
ncbi:MAG: hypothetical protein EPO06_06535 [Burkholderiaceae bacterium]|nr:MAG: hypothetical protein EPO06_06535 [Burkholderiaceae bacterium]